MGLPLVRSNTRRTDMTNHTDLACKFFGCIQRAGFATRAEPRRDKVLACPASKIADISAELAEMTSSSALIRSQNVYSHAASLSIGAGRQWCSNLPCRVQRARELTQFALLYSDRIYVDNFLAGYQSSQPCCASGHPALCGAIVRRAGNQRRNRSW